MSAALAAVVVVGALLSIPAAIRELRRREHGAAQIWVPRGVARDSAVALVRATTDHRIVQALEVGVLLERPSSRCSKWRLVLDGRTVLCPDAQEVVAQITRHLAAGRRA